jgi:hypothetical protein
MKPTPIHMREVVKAIDHACYCQQAAENAIRKAVWERRTEDAEREGKGAPEGGRIPRRPAV